MKVLKKLFLGIMMLLMGAVAFGEEIDLSKVTLKDVNGILVATTADIGSTFEKNTFGLCKLQPTNLYVMLLLKPNGVFVFMIK